MARNTAESMHDVSLSVVIPTYRRAARLHRLLTALEPQVTGKPDRRVVVVNDGSHDDAYAKVAERFQTMIDYVALPQNRGRAAARNAGVRKATGRYLVFTDDDCVPPPHWLDWLVADLQEYPYAAVVAGPTRPLPSDSPGTISRHTVFGVYPRPIYSNGLLSCVPTGNVAVRRDWFERIGGFDEHFAGSEDTHLTWRLRKAGATFHIDDSWFTYHDPAWSMWGDCERSFRYGRNSAINKRLTDDHSMTVRRIPTSYVSVLWTLPKKIRKIRARDYQSEQTGYRRLIHGTLILLRRVCFELGLVRGDRLAAQIGDRSAVPLGN
ncbi:MAG: glycosyltransferase [Proteobacteria bacterium]|nr:glycosyltransferase [Pseudomonadota bacterium]